MLPLRTDWSCQPSSHVATRNVASGRSSAMTTAARAALSHPRQPLAVTSGRRAVEGVAPLDLVGLRLLQAIGRVAEDAGSGKDRVHEQARDGAGCDRPE